MDTVRGRLYRLSMRIVRDPAGDLSWLVGPIKASYPVAGIVSIQAGQSTGEAVVIIRWDGPQGTLSPGQEFSAELPGVPGAITSESGPVATVIAVDDLGDSGAGQASIGGAVVPVVISIAILVGVSLAIRKIGAAP